MKHTLPEIDSIDKLIINATSKYSELYRHGLGLEFLIRYGAVKPRISTVLRSGRPIQQFDQGAGHLTDFSRNRAGIGRRAWHCGAGRSTVDKANPRRSPDGSLPFRNDAS